MVLDPVDYFGKRNGIRTRVFRFFEPIWQTKEEYKEVLLSAWCSSAVRGEAWALVYKLW